MQNSMPVLACTDSNTDIGSIITENEFGWWAESISVQNFTNAVDSALTADLKMLGENSYRYLKQNYTVEHSYKIIAERIK
jgi:hypothetical protein